MKYLVVSDIHGSLYYAKKLDEIINKENPDKIILLGDLYYHGPRFDNKWFEIYFERYWGECYRWKKYIRINEKTEFTETQNKSFLFSNGDSYHIEKALQTI